MDEKVEKRRSSILKKPAVDIQEVQTVVKRRVSFSQKKFVKEFDASLNTMQNSTYEEITKESDSGQSLDKVEAGQNHFILQHSNIHMPNAQLASSILISQIEKDKENINPAIILTENTVQQTINRTYVSTNNTKTDFCPEKTNLNCNTMDLTAFIPLNSQTLKTNRTVVIADNMDMTNLPFKNDKTLLEEFNAETMDLTHVVCPANRKSIINATTRTEAMDFTISVPFSRQGNRQSILNPETMEITCVLPTGNESTGENEFGQKQFFGGRIIKDTMDLTNFVCKNNLKENLDDTSISPQEQSSVDMDLTAVNDNQVEQMVPSNSHLYRNCLEMKTHDHNTSTAAKDPETCMADISKQLPINDINIKETSSNICDNMSVGPDYIKEKSLPLYDVGGSIKEQIQNGNKLLTSPFLQVKALVNNLNRFDCDSQKNSLVNFTTNCSADDTQYLINFSVGSNKNPKSDFSRLIAGDFNPSFLSSKFLPLSEFESDAFTNEALESSHVNCIELDNQEVTEEPQTTRKEKDCNEVHNSITGQFNRKSKENKLAYQTEIISKSRKDSGKIDVIHIDSNSTLKRPYTDSSNDVKNKIAKLKDATESDKTFTVVNKNFSVLSEMISSDTKNISDESVVSFCNNSTEEVQEIQAVESIQSDKKIYIQEKINEMEEVKEIFDEFHNRLTLDIFENNTIMKKEIENIQQRCVHLEKQQSHFEEICQKMSASLNINFETLIEKHQLNDTDSSLEGQLSASESNSASEKCCEFSEVDKELQTICVKVLTIDDRIEQLQKTCQNSWSLVSSTPEEYRFETLHQSVIVIVGVERITGIVKDLQVQLKPETNCRPQNLFIKKEFIKRMNSKTVCGAVGEKYDIVTLLDYIQMEMVHMTDMKKYFSLLSRIGFEMDSNFRVTLKIPSLIIRTVWVVSVNMSDIDNINRDCVSIKAQVGIIDEEKVKSLLEPCPRGFAFLKHLVVNLLNYQKMLENRRKR